LVKKPCLLFSQGTFTKTFNQQKSPRIYWVAWLKVEKRIILGIFSAVIIVLIITTAWLANSQFSRLQTQITALQTRNNELQNQNSDLKNQTILLSNQNHLLQEQVSQLLDQLRICYNASVRIVSTEFVSGFNPYVGLTFANRVNVTVQNFDSKDINGLTLTVELVYNGTELLGSEGYTKDIDVLHAGERLEISDLAFSYLSSRNEGTLCIATLMKEDAILDVWSEPVIWN